MKKRRRGISSIYGFILIFLLSMASVQTWAYSVDSISALQTASDRGQQLVQLRGLEHLSLSFAQGGLVITNTGEIPSTVEYLRVLDGNSSRTLTLQAQLAPGGSTTQPLSDELPVEVVTSLGNVFSLQPPGDPTPAVWSSAEGYGGGAQPGELFPGPANSSTFFLSYGPRVFEFNDSGSKVWSFDAGLGTVTDVLPLSEGDTYVAVGGGDSSGADILYELNATGGIVASFSLPMVSPPGVASGGEYASGSVGGDSTSVYYDGWFYGAGGPIVPLSSADEGVAATTSSSLVLYTPEGSSCASWGNEMQFTSYTPSVTPAGVGTNWSTTAYVGSCTDYTPQLIASGVGGGLVASVFGEPYYGGSGQQAQPGYNPYLVVLLSSTGKALYTEELSSNGVSDVATDGSYVYLAFPGQGRIEAISVTTDDATWYNTGMAVAKVVCAYGDLFAISQSAVAVYSAPAMRLLNTIELPSSSSFESFSEPVQQTSLQSPSFILLNDTTYAAMVVNGTGYSSVYLGAFL